VHLAWALNPSLLGSLLSTPGPIQRQDLLREILLTYPLRFFSSGGGGSNGSSAIKAAIGKVFDRYRDDPTGEPDLIGIEGTMKYFSDTKVDLEGLESFAALEIVQAPAMGEMSREGFVNGWQERG
jgi:hypothetical protein